MSYRQTPRPPRLQNPSPYVGTESFGVGAITRTPGYDVVAFASPPLDALVSPHGDVPFDPFRTAYLKFRDSEEGEDYDPLMRRAKQLADGTLEPSKEGGFWPRPSAEATYPDNKTVFVGNLPSVATAVELERYFSCFGPLVSANIPKNKPNCGFVTFVNRADAEVAIDRMQAFPLHGSMLRPSWGHSQRDKLSRSVPIQTQLAQDQDFLADLLELDDNKRSQLKLYIHTLMDGTVDSFKTFCYLTMASKAASIEPLGDDSPSLDRLSLDDGYLGGGNDDTPRQRVHSATDPFARHGPLADSVNALVDSTELAGRAAWSAAPSTSTSSSDLHSNSDRGSSPTSSLDSEIMKLSAGSSTDHDRFFRAFATGPQIPATATALATAVPATGTVPITSYRSHSGSFSEFERGNALSDNIDLRPRASSHDSGTYHIGSRLQMSSSNPPAGISNLATNIAVSLASPSSSSSSGSTVRRTGSSSTAAVPINSEMWGKGREFYPAASSGTFR